MKNNTSSPFSSPVSPVEDPGAPMSSRLRAWMPFAGSLLIIGSLTGLALFAVMQITLKMEHCRGNGCDTWVDGVIPLVAVLLLWLICITGVMAWIVKIKPWR